MSLCYGSDDEKVFGTEHHPRCPAVREAWLTEFYYVGSLPNSEPILRCEGVRQSKAGRASLLKGSEEKGMKKS